MVMFQLLLIELTCADDADGMVKVLSDAKTDRMLGCHIIGPVSWARKNKDYSFHHCVECR
jgi:hypothetical protein